MASVSYSFAGAAGSALPSGLTYTAGQLLLDGNGGVYSTVSGGNATATSTFTPATADYDVSVGESNLGSGGNVNGFTPLGRYGSGAYYAAYFNSSSGQYFLTRTGVTIGSSATGQVYTPFTLRMRGTAISVVNTSTGVALVSPVTDANITAAGSAGFTVFTGSGDTSTASAGKHLTVLTVTDAPPPAPTVTTTPTTSGVNLILAPPSNATGQVTYAIHASNVSGFTPSGTTAGTGTCIAVQSATTYSDTAAPLFGDTAALNGQARYYRAISTDSAATPVVTTSAQAVGVRLASLVIGFIGDSITLGAHASNMATTGSVPQCVNALTSLLGTYAVTAVNQGIGGSQTSDWLATSTTQEAGGSTTATPGPTSTNLYNTAKAAFHAAGVNLISIMLGANDSNPGNNVTGAIYTANMTTILAQLATDFPGVRVILQSPTYIIPGSYNAWNESSDALLGTAIPAALRSLMNNKTVFIGETSAYRYFANNPGGLSDGVHPNDTGYAVLGPLWALSIANVVTGVLGFAQAMIAMTDHGVLVLWPYETIGLAQWLPIPGVFPPPGPAPTVNANRGDFNRPAF